MIDWIDTLLALATGWALGVVVSRLHVQAQIKLGLRAIVERLEAMTSSFARPSLQAVPVRSQKRRRFR